MDTTFEAIGPNHDTRDRRSHHFDRACARLSGHALDCRGGGDRLTALSVALAAAASTHGCHEAGDIRHRLAATSAFQEQPTSDPSTGVNPGSTPWSRQMQSA